MTLGPAQIHPEQHLGPVLRLGTTGAGLDIDKGIVLIEFASEHAPKLETLDRLLGSVEIALDVAEQLLVTFGASQIKKLVSIRQRLFQRRDRGDDVAQRCAFAAEILRALRFRPYLRILELALYFLEPLVLDVVVKDTPLARQRAR
jgi:hypothetical protein